jgi:hypothetical protein
MHRKHQRGLTRGRPPAPMRRYESAHPAALQLARGFTPAQGSNTSLANSRSNLVPNPPRNGNPGWIDVTQYNGGIANADTMDPETLVAIQAAMEEDSGYIARPAATHNRRRNG